MDCEGVGVLGLADLGVLDTFFTAAPSPGLKQVGGGGRYNDVLHCVVQSTASASPESKMVCADTYYYDLYL